MYQPGHEEDGVSPIHADLPKLRQTINEGLKLFGLTEDHISSIVGIPLTPAYAQRFYHDSPTEQTMCLVGDAAMSHHFWPGRGLNTGLKSAVALARCMATNTGPAVTALQKFDMFMQDLREREMQGRSASMLRREVQLPTWIDEIENIPSNARPAAGSRTDELLRQAKGSRAENDDTFCQNVKAWRDLNERRGPPDWPHLPLPDSTIESKTRRGVTRPRPLTALTLNSSAVANLRQDGSPADRAGWPLHLQTGTSRVQGEVSPAAEQTGKRFFSGTTWERPAAGNR